MFGSDLPNAWQRLSGQEMIQLAPAGAGTTSDSLPLFDRDLILEHRNVDACHGPMPVDGYGFAAGFNALPLGIAEFMPAIRHYPIVFVDAAPSMPVAMVGLTADDNLFLDADGRWQPGAHVPCCLRRFPFITLESGGDAETEKNFEDIVQSAEALEADRASSERFVAAIGEQGLLVPRHLSMRFPDGATYRLDGFLTVDAAKFRTLPAELMQEWQWDGWLDAIALHLASMRNWEILRDLHEQKLQEAAA